MIDHARDDGPVERAFGLQEPGSHTFPWVWDSFLLLVEQVDQGLSPTGRGPHSSHFTRGRRIDGPFGLPLGLGTPGCWSRPIRTGLTGRNLGIHEGSAHEKATQRSRPDT